MGEVRIDDRIHAIIEAHAMAAGTLVASQFSVRIGFERGKWKVRLVDDLDQVLLPAGPVDDYLGETLDEALVLLVSDIEAKLHKILQDMARDQERYRIMALALRGAEVIRG